MANPTSVGVDDGNPAVLETSSAAVTTLTLSPKRRYTIFHNGLDALGNAETNVIFFSVGADPAANWDPAANLMQVVTGNAYEIGPGISSIRFITQANDPTFTIIPSPELFGNY